MKFFVFIVSLFLIGTAHADTVKPSGWKASNGMRSTSNNKIGAGPKMISVEEHKKKNEAVRKSWLSGEKPTVVKNNDGTTTIKRKLVNSKNGRKAKNVWKALNN